MSIRNIIDWEDPKNNPRIQMSHCLCHYSPGEYCGVCGVPSINFPTREKFPLRGDEEVAWRCITWASSLGGNLQSTPFSNRFGTYRIVYEARQMFREKQYPHGWTQAGWYTGGYTGGN